MVNKYGKSALLAAILSGLLTSGCVERRLTINTVPSGALVSLNDEEIGVSPVTVNFNWYGDYKVQIVKEGYEIFNTHRDLKAPVGDFIGVDLFTGVLWPGKFVDAYEWSFELTPYAPMDREELIRDAMKMQEKAAEPPTPAPDAKETKPAKDTTKRPEM